MEGSSLEPSVSAPKTVGQVSAHGGSRALHPLQRWQLQHAGPTIISAHLSQQSKDAVPCMPSHHHRPSCPPRYPPDELALVLRSQTSVFSLQTQPSARLALSPGGILHSSRFDLSGLKASAL